MKFLIALALVAVAVAEPEADPQLLLNSGFSNVLHTPLTYGGLYNGFYGNLGGYRIFKREAEAEPEADPQLLYNTWGSGLYNGFGYSNIIRPSIYGGLGYRLLKREAEAEPEADPALIYSNGLWGSGISTYSGLIRPAMYSSSIIRPAVYTSGIWKREAEAEPEADPALIYNNGLTTYGGLTYSGLIRPAMYSSSIIRPAMYSNLGYRGLWKREAEAEPEADPALIYSNAGMWGGLSTYSNIMRPYAYSSNIIRPAVYGGMWY